MTIQNFFYSIPKENKRKYMYKKLTPYLKKRRKSRSVVKTEKQEEYKRKNKTLNTQRLYFLNRGAWRVSLEPFIKFHRISNIM